MFKNSLLSSFFAEKGFSEVADWLRAQESLKWALVLGWFCGVVGWFKFRRALEVGLGVGKFNLAHETQRKENKLK